MDAAIRTIGLTKRFGQRCAVDHLNLEVPAGTIFGFLGPNGAGKSTTIRLLFGLLRPDAGETWVLGARIPQERLSIASQVGGLVEAPAFYDYLSGRRNLQLMAQLSGGCDPWRIDEVLELVGLSDRQHDRVSTYSHGMRQRLGIAQALLPRPQLIILDEPATGLDPQGLVEVRELMCHLREEEGLTIFLSSHLLHEVEMICTDVGIVSEGRLIKSGKVRDLLVTTLAQVDVVADDPIRAIQIATTLTYVQAAEVRDSYLRVTLKAEHCADLNRDLVMAGLRIGALTPVRSSLEEIYLTLLAEGQHDSDLTG
ncbi:MAG: ABC transporter ATP-binding protein [Candidatus Zipacnadales bacterium]